MICEPKSGQLAEQKGMSVINFWRIFRGSTYLGNICEHVLDVWKCMECKTATLEGLENVLWAKLWPDDQRDRGKLRNQFIGG